MISIFKISIPWPVVQDSMCFNLVRTACGKIIDKFNGLYTYDISTSDHLHIPIVESDVGQLVME